MAMVEHSEPLGLANQEIREMEEPMERVVDLMALQIRGQAYDLIIGDDTSGRIPTLVMRRVINAFRDQPVSTAFVKLPGAFFRTRQMLQRKEEIQRALFVTEYVCGGSKLRYFQEFFGDYGIPYDVATLSMVEEASTYYRQRSDLPLDVTIFSGSRTSGDYSTPKIYNKPFLTGLDKYNPMNRVQEWEAVSDTVLSARADVEMLAENLIDRLRHFQEPRDIDNPPVKRQRSLLRLLPFVKS